MICTKGRRGLPAGPSAFLALLLLTGCAVGGDHASDVSNTPRRDLAGRPVPAPSTPAAAPAASTGPSAAATVLATSGSAASTGSTATSAAGPTPATRDGSSTPEAPYHQIASLDDPPQDNGLGAPAYADLHTIVMEDDGSHARVSVHLGGRLPAKAAAGEAIGIGVDLYKNAGQQESDYQLFADGGPDGWFAYLHDPRGFVRYPGTFSLTTDGLVFTVPWTSLGSLGSGRFSSFCDWTQRRSTGNDAGNDRAPLVADVAFQR